jgi:hypothetical protein
LLGHDREQRDGDAANNQGDDGDDDQQLDQGEPELAFIATHLTAFA